MNNRLKKFMTYENVSGLILTVVVIAMVFFKFFSTNNSLQRYPSGVDTPVTEIYDYVEPP